jgi:hypothetical protein
MSNIIQYFRGEIPETHKKASLSIQEKKPVEYGYVFETKLLEHILETSNPREDADKFRLDWMLKNPNDIWMDSDVSCDKWFTLVDNGKPWFSHVWGYPDIWIMAPMGHVKILLELQKLIILPGHGTASTWCNWLNGHRDEINLIPNGYFRHKQFNVKVGAL